MKTSNLTRAAALALGGGILACAALTASGGPVSAAASISKSVAGPILAAQKAAAAGNWQEALNQAKAAQAVPDRTPFDDVAIDEIMGNAAINLKDYKTATAALEAAADSQANTGLDPTAREQLYHNALLLAAQAQQWQKVVAYGRVLESLNKMDDVIAANMAIAYYNLKDTARATQYAQKSLAAAKAAGKQPDPNALKIVTNAQAASNPAAAEQSFEALVMRTNSPDDWGRLIDHVWGTPGMNDVLAMDLYRLKLVTRSLSGQDASLAGKLANELNDYGDAQRILQSAGLHGADLAKASHNAAREQASLSAEIAAAKRGSGDDALRVAEGLYGYGRYAEAEQLAREAMAKGAGRRGCKTHCEAAEPALLAGMSQAGQGQYAAALATFKAVTGSQAAIKVAHLWSIYARIKQGGTAAAQPAPAQPAPPQSPAH